MNKTFSCVIPVLPKDYLEVKNNLYRLFDMISIERIIFIGSSDLDKLVTDDAIRLGKCGQIEFINENSIIPFELVKESYSKRLSEIEKAYGKSENPSRPGWYYQQFLKMEYCNCCEDEYYLCWDADTIPLRHIEMFSETGIPYLDIKPEYNPPYFDTLKNLLNMDKVIEESFISEHMLIKVDLMKELIGVIMTTEFKGTSFYEKIFNAVKIMDIGFSEFETYGTYVACRHPSEYRLRHWKSIRNTGTMIDRTDISEDDLKWLGTGFDAASFERYHYVFPELAALFNNKEYRDKLTADILYEELLKEGLFGEYRNGGLVWKDTLCPI